MSLVEPICRNVTINGRRSSLRLEQPYFDLLEEICRREGTTLDELCSRLEAEFSAAKMNLSSIIRVHVLRYFADAATDAGHRDAGHGLGDPFGSIIPADRTTKRRRLDARWNWSEHHSTANINPDGV